MKYKAKAYGALCELSEFEINKIEAEKEDFVDQYDHSPETAEEYGCGDMQADIIPSTKEVLEKYNITENEYQVIAKDIAEKLSFGSCGWCV